MPDPLSRAGRRRPAPAIAVAVTVAIAFTVAAVATVTALRARAGHPGGRPPSAAAPTSTVTAPAAAPTTAPNPPPTTGPTPPPTPAVTATTAAAPGAPALPAQDLKIDDTVRQDLLDAGAALNSLPAAAYLGLRPGETYYAYDPATATWWAGAALIPSPASLPAQVSTQDDGSYLVFWRTTGHAWTAEDAGLSGVESTGCPTAVPATVAAVWLWPPGACRPASR